MKCAWLLKWNCWTVALTGFLPRGILLPVKCWLPSATQVCNKRAVPAGKCRWSLAYGWQCKQALSCGTPDYSYCGNCAISLRSLLAVSG